jgi:hypothetical protein
MTVELWKEFCKSELPNCSRFFERQVASGAIVTADLHANTIASAAAARQALVSFERAATG